MTVARLLLMISASAVFMISAGAEDLHLHEPGSAVVYAHSAFAHGYRHGYEEGYHLGNSDVSIGAQPRNKLKNIRGIKVGYSSKFGSHTAFEKGFQAGMKVGYGDGYLGHSFRAIVSLRSAAASLQDTNSSADPRFAYFDQGFFFGYKDGLEHGAEKPAAGKVDFHFVSCANFHPAKQNDAPAENSYCDGYRRGFVLGHADRIALGTDAARLEASK